MPKDESTLFKRSVIVDPIGRKARPSQAKEMLVGKYEVVIGGMSFPINESSMTLESGVIQIDSGGAQIRFCASERWNKFQVDETETILVYCILFFLKASDKMMLDRALKCARKMDQILIAVFIINGIVLTFIGGFIESPLEKMGLPVWAAVFTLLALASHIVLRWQKAQRNEMIEQLSRRTDAPQALSMLSIE